MTDHVFHLIINGHPKGFFTLSEAFDRLVQHFSNVPDEFDAEHVWSLQNRHLDFMYMDSMTANLFDALCENLYSFRLYLEMRSGISLCPQTLKTI